MEGGRSYSSIGIKSARKERQPQVALDLIRTAAPEYLESLATKKVVLGFHSRYVALAA